MPVTTFLQEKIRDPRVKGAPLSEEMSTEENFNITFETTLADPIHIELEFDPSIEEEDIVFSFLTPRQLQTAFYTGLAESENFNTLQTNLSVTVAYNGRRSFDITYTNNTGQTISSTLKIAYTKESFQYIRTMYMQCNDAEANNVRQVSPYIYLHGYLADSAAVVAKNLAANSVTTAKLADQSVTTAKIANSAVTSAKINFSYTDLTPNISNVELKRYKIAIN